MRLRTLLDMPELALELLHGEAELDRPIHSVMTTDLLDPGRYLTGGELVLTGMVWRRDPADSAAFVQALHGAGVAAVAAGDSVTGVIPTDLIDACRDAGLPLLRVPAEVAFATVTEHVARRLSGVLAEDVTEFLVHHRDLLSPGTSGMTAVLDLVRDKLSMGCWVMSATGRVIAGNGPPPAEDERGQALRHYLSGGRVPGALPGSGLSVVAVGDPAQPRLANWLMLCDSDAADWTAEQHRLARELAALIAAERARLDHERAALRPAADELVKMIAADTEPGQLAHQMRLAGLPSTGAFAVVAAHLRQQPGLARSVVEELLVPIAPAHGAPSTPQVPGSCGVGPRVVDAAVAVLDEGVVAIVSGDAGQVRAAVEAAAVLAPALAAGCPLRIGVSGPASGVAGLRGALDEARHGCTLAQMSRDRVAVVGHDDLSSHMMLLAAVPDDVRRAYRNRLLGPLVEYDRQHRADLIPTLRAFLAHSGSWTKCAEVLHVHVNTLRYRIQRIEQMTGRDLGKLEHRVDLFLALTLAGKS